MQEKKCVQCGKSFTMFDDEIAFFNRKNLSIPKRCQACRDLNKQKKQDTKMSTYSEAQNPKRQFHVDSKQNRRLKKTIGQWFMAVLLALFGIGGVYYGWVFDDQPNEDAQRQIAETNQIGQVLSFREKQYAMEHFQKHGGEFNYQTLEQYIQGANRVISSPEALHKTEREDGDDVYYLEETNEFVIVSTDGYIRTYFKPEDGLAYYQRQ